MLKFDQEKNRVSLGMKQLGEDPWVASRAATRRARVSSQVVEPHRLRCVSGDRVGIEGLVHVSEMTGPTK